jgi:uroporphyrinogen decarboxylase
MGAIVEISDRYDYTYLRQAKDFVTRKWHRFPVQERQDWVEKIQWRYDPDQEGRFPADFDARCKALKDREHVLPLYFPGPFWQMREWCGFEGLCLMMADQPAFVEEMVEFHAGFVLETLDRVLAQAQPDYVMLSEDMAYKLHSMISPKMVRRFLLPTWQRITRKLKEGGCGVVSIDSDGYIGELVPLFIEGGFESTWPVEAAAGNDLPGLRAKYGRQISYGGGIDKRALAAGGEVMLAELARLEPVMRAGGYLPGCDHGVPPDISWPNFIDYARRLAQLTGWL